MKTMYEDLYQTIDGLDVHRNMAVYYNGMTFRLSKVELPEGIIGYGVKSRHGDSDYTIGLKEHISEAERSMATIDDE